LILRQVNPTDVQVIYEINSGIQAFPWTKKALEEEMQNSQFKGWVFCDKVNITGYLFARLGDDVSEIMTLGVSQHHQRTGAATKLLNQLISLGRDIILEVSDNNEGAVTLYKKMGFKIFNIRKSYYPDGSNALCMKLNIANPQ